MSNQFIGIEYDRSHLQSSYEPKFFHSLHYPLDAIDFAFLLINILALLATFVLFACNFKLTQIRKVESPVGGTSSWRKQNAAAKFHSLRLRRTRRRARIGSTSGEKGRSKRMWKCGARNANTRLKFMRKASTPAGRDDVEGRSPSPGELLP